MSKKMSKRENPIELKCKRCGRKWEYTGDKEYYASCPDCKTSVKIPQDE